MHGLIDDAKTALNLTEGHYAMLPVDVPNDTHYSSAMVAQVSSSSSSSSSSSASQEGKITTMGRCSAVEPNAKNNYLSVEQSFKEYFYHFENGKRVALPPNGSTTLLQAPTHGKISEVNDTDGTIVQLYTPNKDYRGDDKVIYRVTYQGKTVDIVYFLKVSDHIAHTDEQDDIVCFEKYRWKISSLPTGTASTTITYSNLINSAVDAFKGFSDLPASEVGTTTGRAKSKT